MTQDKKTQKFEKPHSSQVKPNKIKPPEDAGVKQKTQEAAVDEKPTSTPQAKPKEQVVQKVEATSTTKKSIFTPEELRLKHNLGAISMFTPITVARFQQLTNTGSAAKALLDLYVNQGLVERHWSRASGRYSLTRVGEAKLSELDEREKQWT